VLAGERRPRHHGKARITAVVDEGRIVDPPDIEGQIEILGKGEDRGVGFGLAPNDELRGLSGRDEFRVRIRRRVSLASMTESEGGPEIAVERRWG